MQNAPPLIRDWKRDPGKIPNDIWYNESVEREKFEKISYAFFFKVTTLIKAKAIHSLTNLAQLKRRKRKFYTMIHFTI